MSDEEKLSVRAPVEVWESGEEKVSVRAPD